MPGLSARLGQVAVPAADNIGDRDRSCRDETGDRSVPSSARTGHDRAFAFRGELGIRACARPLRMPLQLTKDQARSSARSLAITRVAIGAVAIVLPRVVLRPW